MGRKPLISNNMEGARSLPPPLNMAQVFIRNQFKRSSGVSILTSVNLTTKGTINLSQADRQSVLYVAM